MKYLVKKTENLDSTVDFKVLHQTTALHLPRGGNYIFVEGVDTKHPMLQVNEGILEVVEDGTPIALQALYDDMVTDVYDTMYSVFGTRNDASATAFAATYEAMAKRPANYIDEALGLHDEAAVLAYANERIATADAYGVIRLKRIAQFEAERAAILAGE